MRVRTLTPRIKTKVLDRWAQTREDFLAAKSRGEVPKNAGGYGYPDPEIFSLCDRLNELPGIVTMQSCSGHMHDWEEPGMQAMWSGQLWLGMNYLVQSRFINRVDDLLIHSCIERCNLIFMIDQIDVADIVFAGLNRGPDVLAESANTIYKFFDWLTKDVRP